MSPFSSLMVQPDWQVGWTAWLGAIVTSELSLPLFTVTVCGFGSAFEMVSASAGSANSIATAPSPKIITILIAHPSRSVVAPVGSGRPAPANRGAELSRNDARIVSPSRPESAPPHLDTGLAENTRLAPLPIFYRSRHRLQPFRRFRTKVR